MGRVGETALQRAKLFLTPPELLQTFPGLLSDLSQNLSAVCVHVAVPSVSLSGCVCSLCLYNLFFEDEHCALDNYVCVIVALQGCEYRKPCWSHDEGHTLGKVVGFCEHRYISCLSAFTDFLYL